MRRIILFKIFISLFLLSGYILPYWFVIKESSEVRSRFNINYIRFEGSIRYTDSENNNMNCGGEFTMKRSDGSFEVSINCEDGISRFRFKDAKLSSQTIKSRGSLFIKPISYIAEYLDLILPLPISSGRLKERVCSLIKDCDNVGYKRLGGVINYRFASKEGGSYYMIEKESYLPSALFLSEKNLSIESKRYFSFSTNIKFPSIIDIKTDGKSLTITVEELTLE